MKLGAENSKKTALAVGLFIVALIMLVRFISSFTGGSGPAAATTATAAAPAPVRPLRRTGRTSSRGKHEKNAAPVTPQLDPRLNLAGLKDSEDTKYDGTGRNIFTATEEPKIEKPQGTGLLDAKKTSPPPPPPPVHVTPPPQPINLKFFGFASGPDHKHVFLASGDDVMVATEGEIVQRRYKIVKVNNTSIEVLDVLSNNKQTIPLTAG